MTRPTVATTTVTAEPPHEAVGPVVTYARHGSDLVREVSTAAGSSRIVMNGRGLPDHLPPDGAWYVGLARGNATSTDARGRARVRSIDLFSGSGGLSLGLVQAAEAIGRRHSIQLAVDIEADALDVFDYNLGPRKTWRGSVRDLFDPTAMRAAADPSRLEPRDFVVPGSEWLLDGPTVDVVIGGPPCQGHSNLNNHTRRTDERNQLYYWMALAASAVEAKAVIVENVASVKADAGDVVGSTIEAFGRLGYHVAFDGVLSADVLGTAQTRRRHFLVAIRHDALAPEAAAAFDWLREVRIHPLSVLDVLADLQDVCGPEAADDYDRTSVLSDENVERIDHLFDHDLYELPDHIRPIAHRDGHTYPSVYGRMHADKPAGTLSTGFLTPGRGRYVHPTRRRSLTLHEGARLQGFPDTFRFQGASGGALRRTGIARMIGDAVPPPMAFHVALATLAGTTLDR